MSKLEGAASLRTPKGALGVRGWWELPVALDDIVGNRQQRFPLAANRKPSQASLGLARVGMGLVEHPLIGPVLADQIEDDFLVGGCGTVFPEDGLHQFAMTRAPLLHEVDQRK